MPKVTSRPPFPLPEGTTAEIKISKHEAEEPKNYTPIAPLGLQKIYVGDEDAQGVHEIYDFNKQKRSCWFILDLETGSHGWFPGCIIKGTVQGTAEIKAAPDESAGVLELISDTSVEVLEIDAVDQEPFIPGWYKVKHIATGYVQKNAISNLRYEKPNQ